MTVSGDPNSVYVDHATVGAGVEIDFSPLTFDFDPTNNRLIVSLSMAANLTTGFDFIFSGGTLDQFTSVTRNVALTTGADSANINVTSSGKKLIMSVTGSGITGPGDWVFNLASTDIGGAAPVISSTLTASGTYGTAISTYAITATNTPTSYNATSLPPGLSINTATGQITGTPTTPVGSPFSTTISATNGSGTDTKTLVFTINRAALSISGVVVNNKVYNGNTTGQVDYNSAVLNGVVGSDAVQADVGASATNFADRNVGTGKTATVTGITLSGAQANRYTMTNPTATANITAKALTTTGLTASAKVYDGTTTANVSGTATLQATEAAGTGTTSDGKPYSVDSVSLSGTATATFATRNVGTAKAITVTGLSLSGTGNANYSVVQPTTLTADVTAKALTVAGVTAAAARIYDGTTAAGLSGTAAFLSTEAAGAGTTVDGRPYSVDSVTVSGSGTGTFADRNVGTAKAVTVIGLTVTGTGSTNYVVTQPTGLTADIAAKALSITGVAANSSRVYDGTTVAGLSGTPALLSTEAAGAGTTSDGRPYSVDSVTVSGTAAGAFADRNVGSAKAVTVTGLTLTGSGDTNYTATQPSGLTATITVKALTVAGVTAVASRIYDATTVAGLAGTPAFLSTEAAGAGTTSDGKPYSVDTIAIGGTAAGAFADKDVAIGKAITVTGLTVTGTDSSNYSLAQPTGLTSAVTKKTLTIYGVTAANKVYDGTTAATLSGTPTLQSAEAPGAGTTSDGKPYTGDTFSAGGTITGTFSTKDVATAKTLVVTGITLTGAQAGNYDVAALTATADITPKALTISGVAAVASRIYNGTTVAGLTGIPAFSAAEATGLGSTSDGVPYSVDNVTIGGTAAGAFSDRNVGIAKVITVTGLTVTGTGAANYNVTPLTGLTANVTAKALNVAGITATATRVYNSTATAALLGTPAFLTAEAAGTGTTTDGAPYTVDTLTLAGTASGAFATKTIGTGKAITVTGLTVTGADNANYTISLPTTLTADVTAAGLTVSGITANNKVYDGNLAAVLNTGSATLVGVFSGDTVTATGTATGTFASKTVGTGKSVQVASLTLSGADAANYSLTLPSTTATITARNLTVTGLTGATKVYDGNATATPTYSGATFINAVSGDTVTLVTTGATASFSSKIVATGGTVTIAGLTLGGSDAANYTLTQPTLTADITVRNLTVTGITASDRGYNGGTSATLNTSSAVLTGVISGDTTTLVTSGAVGSFSNPNTGQNKTVQITGLTLAGADATNYALTPPTTTAAISSSGVNIAISNLNFTYDGTPKTPTITITPNVSATITYSNGGRPPTNAGTYTVSVSVLENNYSGSASAQLVIAKAAQTMAFSLAGSDFKVGASLGLNATASTGLPVTFSVLSGTATLSGSAVTITQAGAVTIRASQAGNENYNAAFADQSFTGVASDRTSQTIDFAALPNVRSDSGGFALSATASSGLPVSFAVISGPASIVGGRLVLSGATGLVVVRASQPGNAVYSAAPDVTRAFAVTQIVPDIFFGDLTVDPAENDVRGELAQSPHARVETKTGDIAAAIFAGTNRGTILIVSPSLGLNVSLDITIAANGAYSVPFTSAGRSLVLSGSLNGSLLVGRIPTLKVSFSTTVQTRVGVTSTLAGIYETDAVNSATGGTSTIVGANGQIVVVANSGVISAGAAGTVNTDGTFNLAATGATISGAVDAPTTTVSGMITMAGQAPVAFDSISTASRTDQLVNLSSRVSVAPNRILITGFVIGGVDSKRVLIRGIGPGLAAFGVTGALTNPKLQLFDATNKLVVENDDWSGTDTAAAFAQVGAFALTPGSRDAAVLTTLTPGAYTVQITGGTETGVALVEIYDASANTGAEAQRLINISSRGSVETGANGLLIGGFVVTGNAPKKVLIRGVGPGLTAFGVTGTVTDPRLAVYSGTTVVAQNDNWSTAQPINAQQSVATAAELSVAAQTIGAFALTAGSADSALIITLAPGAYTAQISGANGGTGAALVEIYELP